VDTLHQEIQDQRHHYESILLNLRDSKSSYEEQQRLRFLSLTDDIERVMSQLQDQEIFNY
jgi:coiled-coil domain-containing protein 77